MLLLFGIAAAAALAEGPPAGFTLNANDPVFKSPDGKMRVEQYYKNQEDDSRLYQFWTFDADHQHPFLLNPGGHDEQAGYPAGFRFSPNSQWLVRMRPTVATW